MRFQHKQFYAASEQLEAMRWLKKIIKDEDFDGMAFALAQPYSRWEIDEVIGWELQRNLVIAIVCVLITTFVLIADLCSCILVLTTILLNLVSVITFNFRSGKLNKTKKLPRYLLCISCPIQII